MSSSNATRRAHRAEDAMRRAEDAARRADDAAHRAHKILITMGSIVGHLKFNGLIPAEQAESMMRSVHQHAGKRTCRRTRRNRH